MQNLIQGPDEQGPHLTIGVMFSDATLVIQLIMVLLTAAAIAAIVIAVRKSLAKDRSAGSPFVSNLRIAGPLLGLLGTAYGLMNSMIGTAVTSTTDLAVIAPGLAEAALVAGIGLLAGTVACVANWAIESGPAAPKRQSPAARELATSA